MILTFDLGVYTGFAAFHEGKVFKSGSFHEGEFVGTLISLLNEYTPRCVVAEEPVLIRGPLGDTLRRVTSTFRSLVPNAIFIPPSLWKPHPISKTKLEDVKSPHERDAIHMAMWVENVYLKSHT